MENVHWEVEGGRRNLEKPKTCKKKEKGGDSIRVGKMGRHKGNKDTMTCLRGKRRGFV